VAAALVQRQRWCNGNVGATATLVQRQRWCNGKAGTAAALARGGGNATPGQQLNDYPNIWATDFVGVRGERICRLKIK
jgi:hypothetical protein